MKERECARAFSLSSALGRNGMAHIGWMGRVPVSNESTPMRDSA